MIYELYKWVERLVAACGFSSSAVPIVRHIVMALVAILLSWLSYVLCYKLLIPIVNKFTKHTAAKWDDVLLGTKVLRAACGIVPAIVIWELLPLVFLQLPVVHELVARLTAIYITVMTVRLVIQFVNAFNQLDSHQGKSFQQYIRSFCGVIKIIAIFVGTIVVVAIAIGKSPLSLFAGLGAASAVLMLVFKDTIEGLVAGIRLTSEDMLRVGDWITVSSSKADGVVEEVSLTTVKVRNFDNTIVTISPITLVNGSFQNWKGMQESDGRRVSRTVYFDFRSIHFVDEKHTRTNMTEYREAMEKMLAADPRVNQDMTLMVRQLEATQSGLPVQFYFFLKEKEWKPYEEQLAQIMECAYALAQDYGLKIYQQYPYQ
jgi:miniconductance mechanosensitive channel